MSTPARRALSLAVGWLADRRLPRSLRAPAYRAYCRATGADPTEAELQPADYPSLGAFFVRRLRPGARPLPQDPRALPCPVDGTVQAVGAVAEGRLLQAKGRDYALRELLGGVGEDLELEGGVAWTVYLSPRDYHRIHCPVDARLTAARWLPGARYSVAPKVLDRLGVLEVNERVALRLERDDAPPLLLVLVGALNVGRMRVVGVEPGDHPRLDPAPRFARGAELARFEMGSTIVLVAPPGSARPRADLAPGTALRLHEPIGELLP